jgi:hypothetical protein
MLACGAMLSAPVGAEKPAQAPPSTAPTRHEIWVPTKDLKEVLKKHPNAVLLDREQYEALIRDAGKVGPLKGQDAPVDAVIEEVKVTARVPADASMATLIYEYHIHGLKDGWNEVTLPYSLGGRVERQPVPMSIVGDAESALVDFACERPVMVFPDAANRKTKVVVQGQGRHVMRLTFASPIQSRNASFSLMAYIPEEKNGVAPNAPPSARAFPTVRMELPAGMKPQTFSRLLPDGAWEVLPQPGSRTFGGPGSQPKTIHTMYMTWRQEVAVVGAQLMMPEVRVTTVYRIVEDRVIALSTLSWSGSQPLSTDKAAIQLPPGARVLEASLGAAFGEVKKTITDSRVEFEGPSVRSPTGQARIEFEQPLENIGEAGRKIALPVVSLEGLPTTSWLCGILVDPDVQVRLGDLGRLARSISPQERTELQNAVLRIPARAGSAVLPSPDYVGDFTTLPQFLGGFSFDTSPDQPLVEVQMVPDRFSVDADALVEVSSHEVGVVRTLVFHGETGSISRALVTLPAGEVFLEVPVTSGEHVEWKQVGSDLEVNWPKGLAKGAQTSLTVRTRRDIAPQAADGSATEKVAIASIPVSGASRVSGYAALKFDESWKVNVTDSTGLETRDARATPVRGRMAWFGLKDWKLGFDLSRRAPVHDATVTAYALPRAKQVEIEGQITLSVTGAPLRKFEVKLPPTIAPLLRVTSPLVGEQSLDPGTGIWTFTLGRELMGTGNVRFRLSLPAENATAEPGSDEGTLTAVLPDITLPGARRVAGRWVVEANTDTELAFTTRGVQPVDARRPPNVEGYAPQHRVIAAFSHGGGEHEIRLTATRHEPAVLAGMVLVHLRMTSVLGEDGSARHEAVFTLRHNGRQFATVRLPEGAGLLSTVVDGKAVKPVKAGTNEVRLPLASRIGDTAPVEVKVMYDTPSAPWGGSGRLGLTPPTLGAEVPVMETAWKVYAPAGFTLRHDGSGLVEEKTYFEVRAPGLMEGFFGDFYVEKSKWADAPVDFLPGGVPLSEAASSLRENQVSYINDRLRRIILPRVQFSGASVEEAVEFLRISQRDYDRIDGALALPPIALKPGASPSTATIHLDLKDVPMSEALRYVAELAGMKVRINPPYVEVVPLGDDVSEMFVRQYKLSLAQLLALKDKARAGTGPAAPADPFAPAGGAKKIEGNVSDVDAFKSQGVPFPEGSMLRYDSDSQTLVVSNTEPNLDTIDTLVNSLKPAPDDDLNLGELGDTGAMYGTAVTPGAYYVDKMSKIIFPSVEFRGASLDEAVEFLRIKSRDYDSLERDPSKKGVNLIIKPGAAPSTATISLDLKDVPMSEALRYITELGGMKYKVEPYAVVVLPVSDVATEMYTRTFKVPPTFFWSESGQGLSARRTAKDVLSSQGIPFPEGASAVFLPSTSQLVVRNTQPSLDLIEGYVDQLINVPSSEQARRTAFNRTKSGLVPLELELPTSGQVLTLSGHQRPMEFTLHYLSWERQVARTSLLVLLGATFFWVLRGGRVWLLTFAALLLLKCVPILLLPSWSAACHALLLGWLMALAIWLAWRVACWWRRRTMPMETAEGREVLV